MGYIRHHSIVITSWNKSLLGIVHEKAKQIFETGVSEIVKSKVNEFDSFFIAPDGSKEGWAESNIGNKNRADIIAFIEAQKYEDGGNSIRFAELYYGDDELESEIINHN